MSRMGDGLASVLRSVAVGGVVLFLGLVVVGGLVVGAWPVVAGGVVAGAVVLFVSGAFTLAGARETSPTAAARWRQVADAAAFTPRSTPVDATSVYETSVDDRPVTARLVAGDATDPETATTLVETPTDVARPGTGFAVEAAGDDVPLPDDVARGVRSLVSSSGGGLSVDDRVGVVRYEGDGTLADPAALERAAGVVAAVAAVVEERATVDEAADRDRSVEYEDSAHG